MYNANTNERVIPTNVMNTKASKEFLIAKGDFSLLTDFGTHQSEVKNHQLASSAVAFIESPLLKNCDILDLPGFAATSEDDALHRFNTQENVTDILIYLSRSNGFLQDRDLDYLRECLKSLRPIEHDGVNELGKLSNLFIVASQARAVNNGNSSELTEILDRRLHLSVKDSVFLLHSQACGHLLSADHIYCPCTRSESRVIAETLVTA